MLEGKIVAVCVSEKKHTKKEAVKKMMIDKDHGIVGDAHAGPGERQVSLLARESIEKMEREGLDLPFGIFGENMVTEGLNLMELPVGTLILAGHECLLEITVKGKECHTPCAIFKNVGFCIMPLEGIFTKVIKSGEVGEGDKITVVSARQDR